MKNRIVINGDVTEIHIDSKHGHFITLVDTEDLPKLEFLNSIYVHKDNKVEGLYYAIGAFGSKQYRIHRLITNAPRGVIVDHRNNNGLDNRKFNLREADRYLNSQNRRGLDRSNTSGVRGVYWEPERQKWRVQVEAFGKRHRIGRFDTLEAAELAAEQARQDFHVC